MAERLTLKPGLIKAFLFDLDGTIWNSDPVIADTLEQILSSHNVYIGKDQLVDDLYFLRSPLKVLRKYDSPKPGIFWSTYRTKLQSVQLFFPDTHEIFDCLESADRIIGFVTSLKKEFTLSLMRKFSLMDKCAVLITPSECSASKPSPRPLELALERISVDASQALYLGDHEIDVQAAKNAGCRSALAKWNNCTKTEMIIQEFCPDYVLSSLNELKKLT